MAKLHRFEGREVIATRVAITNAGDGLSQAMAIEPTELAIGDRVFIVLECTVGPIKFDPVKDSDKLTRVQTLRAGMASLVDETLVREVLDQQQIKLDEARGITRLSFAEGDHEPAAAEG